MVAGAAAPAVPAQAPASVAAFDETETCQLAQAPQHGIEVYPGLDRDGGGPGTAAGGQRVEHPGAVGVELVATRRVIVRGEHDRTRGRALAGRPGVRRTDCLRTDCLLSGIGRSGMGCSGA